MMVTLEQALDKILEPILYQEIRNYADCMKKIVFLMITEETIVDYIEWSEETPVDNAVMRMLAGDIFSKNVLEVHVLAPKNYDSKVFYRLWASLVNLNIDIYWNGRRC